MESLIVSSSKRICNDIANYEKLSDKFVNKASYYIVRLLINNYKDTSDLVDMFVQKTYGDDVLLAVYSYKSELYLLFSPLENSEHYLDGSHQMLCSFYSSLISKTKGVDVKCSIIEINSKTEIIIYFQSKVYENIKRTLVELSGLKKKDVENKTLEENISYLKSKKVFWDAIPPHQRFGRFYKSKNGKLTTWSEFIDMNNVEKYNSYFFD